jgi:hypothetical protein
MAMAPTTTCPFSVLCVARCGPKLGRRKKKKKLLGVKDATIELAGAGDGLRAKILRATAKYVRQASTERRR